MNNVIYSYIHLLIPTSGEKIFMAIGGAIGASFTFLFGEWSKAIIWLIIMVGIDYITGTVASLKTGEWCSGSGFKGIFKKVFIFVMVALCHGLDQISHLNFLAEMCIFAYAVNEFGSILENIDRMGYGNCLPSFVKPAMRLLKHKEKQMMKGRFDNE